MYTAYTKNIDQHPLILKFSIIDYPIGGFYLGPPVLTVHSLGLARTPYKRCRSGGSGGRKMAMENGHGILENPIAGWFISWKIL